MTGTFVIEINGTTRRVSADADTPLLWVLRDTLGLRGTKFGCGVGICGACTVHVDGEAVRSCALAIGDLPIPSRITTIEGLAATSVDGEHPLQRAWIAEQVPQCGYCQPGMIMAAAALLRDVPSPSDAEIDETITNICRCGTYPRIRKAIHRAAG